LRFGSVPGSRGAGLWPGQGFGLACRRDLGPAVVGALVGAGRRVGETREPGSREGEFRSKGAMGGGRRDFARSGGQCRFGAMRREPHRRFSVDCPDRRLAQCAFRWVGHGRNIRHARHHDVGPVSFSCPIDWQLGFGLPDRRDAPARWPWRSDSAGPKALILCFLPGCRSLWARDMPGGSALGPKGGECRCSAPCGLNLDSALAGFPVLLRSAVCGREGRAASWPCGEEGIGGGAFAYGGVPSQLLAVDTGAQSPFLSCRPSRGQLPGRGGVKLIRSPDGHRVTEDSMPADYWRGPWPGEFPVRWGLSAGSEARLAWPALVHCPRQVDGCYRRRKAVFLADGAVTWCLLRRLGRTGPRPRSVVEVLQWVFLLEQRCSVGPCCVLVLPGRGGSVWRGGQRVWSLLGG